MRRTRTDAATIVPVAEAARFNPNGGKAICSTVAGGAQHMKITYEGGQLGGGMSLVGPGAAPSVAPTVGAVAGTGIETGVHQYAYTHVTAAGESLPSPLGTITVGYTPAPASAPTAGLPQAGTGLDSGSHDYAVTVVTATGETTPGPVSGSVSPSYVSPPGAMSEAAFGGGGTIFGNNQYYWGCTVISSLGETTVGALVGDTHIAPATRVELTNIPTGPAGTTSRKIYRTTSGGGTMLLLTTLGNNTTTAYTDTTADVALGAAAPTVNTNAAAQVPLSGIPLGPAPATARKLYRRFNGSGTFKLITTIADNTTTTYTDSTANASLGAAAPSSNAAIANQVSVTVIAIGASPTTSRRLYRTAVGEAQLKLLTTVADNTTTTYADSTPDGSLGVNAPTSDLSGLAQPSGQVNAGSTSLLLASAGGFLVTGGWANLGGGQAVRYTGIGGQEIPPVAPTATLQAGAGLDPGVHGYAYTWVTALGESLPSPIFSLTTGGTNNQAVITNVAVGPTGTLSRNFYKTVANGSQLKYASSIADNVTTAIGTDTQANAAFVDHANAPTQDRSGLDGRSFLTGIPTSGPGAIVGTIPYGTVVVALPALTGVSFVA